MVNRIDISQEILVLYLLVSKLDENFHPLEQKFTSSEDYCFQLHTASYLT